MAEWLRRWTWNPLGSTLAGSNPASNALTSSLVWTTPPFSNETIKTVLCRKFHCYSVDLLSPPQLCLSWVSKWSSVWDQTVPVSLLNATSIHCAKHSTIELHPLTDIKMWQHNSGNNTQFSSVTTWSNLQRICSEWTERWHYEWLVINEQSPLTAKHMMYSQFDTNITKNLEWKI